MSNGSWPNFGFNFWSSKLITWLLQSGHKWGKWWELTRNTWQINITLIFQSEKRCIYDMCRKILSLGYNGVF